MSHVIQEINLSKNCLSVYGISASIQIYEIFNEKTATQMDLSIAIAIDLIWFWFLVKFTLTTFFCLLEIFCKVLRKFCELKIKRKRLFIANMNDSLRAALLIACAFALLGERKQFFVLFFYVENSIRYYMWGARKAKCFNTNVLYLFIACSNFREVIILFSYLFFLASFATIYSM